MNSVPTPQNHHPKLQLHLLFISSFQAPRQSLQFSFLETFPDLLFWTFLCRNWCLLYPETVFLLGTRLILNQTSRGLNCVVDSLETMLAWNVYSHERQQDTQRTNLSDPVLLNKVINAVLTVSEKFWGRERQTLISICLTPSMSHTDSLRENGNLLFRKKIIISYSKL